MNDQLPVPDPEQVKQTIANSRRRRLKMEIAGLELEEIIARLEHQNRQRRLQRLQQVLSASPIESQPKQNPKEVSSQ